MNMEHHIAAVASMESERNMLTTILELTGHTRVAHFETGNELLAMLASSDVRYTAVVEMWGKTQTDTLVNFKTSTAWFASIPYIMLYVPAFNIPFIVKAGGTGVARGASLNTIAVTFRDVLK
jgi:DNA-binding NtrC family response regulator